MYQAGFGVIFWGKKSQTFIIPIYSTTDTQVYIPDVDILSGEDAGPDPN